MREVGRARVGILDGNPPGQSWLQNGRGVQDWRAGWTGRQITDADLELLSASCQAARAARPAEQCSLYAQASGSHREGGGRSATVTMTMGVERDKTGLRRRKQHGRSQSWCLLRREGEGREEKENRHAAETVKSRRHRLRISGEATMIKYLVPSQRSRQ